MRRTRYQRRYGAFGACDLSGSISGLSTALEQANALGLYSNPVVVDAQAIYDAYSTMSLDCAGIAAATPVVDGATARVQVLVAANTPAGGFTVGPELQQASTPMVAIGLGLVGLYVAWWVVTR